jgi:succinate dehydrogenase / fumarate reductase, iron-sulfur subunit
MLFTAAKVAHPARMPRRRVEAARPVCVTTGAMLAEGFGNCSNHYECEAACPKGISVRFIAKLNREFIKSQTKGIAAAGQPPGGVSESD